MSFSSLARSFARPASVLALLVLPLCSGCGVFTSLLKVNPDGSGTIVQTTRLNAMATQFMSSMAAADDSTSGQADAASSKLFTKKQVRARAAQLGKDVRFVRMERLDEQGGKGYRAVYAFDDVTKVRLSPDQQMDVGDDGPGEKADDAETKTPITFDFETGTPATLTMHLGGLADPQGAVEMNKDGTSDSSNTAQQMRMARMMLRDTKMRVAVEPQGALVETDAAHRSEKDRITLMELNFNELMADQKAFERFMKAENQDLTDAEIEIMVRTLPGVRVETKETVTMRFE